MTLGAAESSAAPFHFKGNPMTKMNGLGARFEAFKLAAANELLPAMTDYVIPAIQDYVLPALEKLAGAIGGAISLIGDLASGAMTAFGEFKTAVGSAIDWVIDKLTEFMALLDRVIEKAKNIGKAVAEALSFDGTSSANTFTEDFGMGGSESNNSNAFGGAGGAAGGQMLGAAIVNGAVLGAMNSLNENRAALAAVFDGITQIARETLQINSPSRVFEEIGGNIGQGMAQGIAASNAMVAAAVQSMGSGAVNATNGMVGDILGGLDTLLAGSQKGGAALAWVNTLIGASQEIKKGTFGFASMARVLAQGAALVKGINGARGGRSVARVGGSPAAATAAAPAQQNVQTLNFTLQNDTLGIGANLVRQIAAQLNEAQRNGSTLIRATVS